VAEHLQRAAELGLTSNSFKFNSLITAFAQKPWYADVLRRAESNTGELSAHRVFAPAPNLDRILVLLGEHAVNDPT
jgi:hypothetical protein